MEIAIVGLSGEISKNRPATVQPNVTIPTTTASIAHLSGSNGSEIRTIRQKPTRQVSMTQTVDTSTRDSPKRSSTPDAKPTAKMTAMEPGMERASTLPKKLPRIRSWLG